MCFKSGLVGFDSSLGIWKLSTEAIAASPRCASMCRLLSCLLQVACALQPDPAVGFAHLRRQLGAAPHAHRQVERQPVQEGIGHQLGKEEGECKASHAWDLPCCQEADAFSLHQIRCCCSQWGLHDAAGLQCLYPTPGQLLQGSCSRALRGSCLIQQGRFASGRTFLCERRMHLD